MNTVIDRGFFITKLIEPAPTGEILIQRQEWKDERGRPMFVLIAAVKALHSAPPQ